MSSPEQHISTQERLLSRAVDFATALFLGLLIGACCWLWLGNIEGVAIAAALSDFIQCL